MNQLISIKIDNINRFRSDTFPQCLEFRHCELIGINLQLDIFVTGILRLHGAAVINGIEDFNNGVLAVSHFISNYDFAIRLVCIILVGQCTLLVNIPIDNHVKEDCLSCLAINDLLIAPCIHNNLALEQVGGNRYRAASHSVGKFGLQALCKAVVAFAGNDRQNVNRMHIISQHICIHTLAILIDAQAQTTADFLAFPNLAAALLQGADLENIRVIPAFTQCRVGEDEPHRRLLWITIQKQLLVFHNKVVGINII